MVTHNLQKTFFLITACSTLKCQCESTQQCLHVEKLSSRILSFRRRRQKLFWNRSSRSTFGAGRCSTNCRGFSEVTIAHFCPLSLSPSLSLKPHPNNPLSITTPQPSTIMKPFSFRNTTSSANNTKVNTQKLGKLFFSIYSLALLR